MLQINLSNDERFFIISPTVFQLFQYIQEYVIPGYYVKLMNLCYLINFQRRKPIPESKLNELGGIQNKSYEPDTTTL